MGVEELEVECELHCAWDIEGIKGITYLFQDALGCHDCLLALQRVVEKVVCPLFVGVDGNTRSRDFVIPRRASSLIGSGLAWFTRSTRHRPIMYFAYTPHLGRKAASNLC